MTDAGSSNPPMRGGLRIRVTSRRRCNESQDSDAEVVADAYDFVMVIGTMEAAMQALAAVNAKPMWMASMAPSAPGLMFDFGGVNLGVGDELDMLTEV